MEPYLRRSLALLWLLLGLGWGSSAWAATEPPGESLVFGIYPYLSPSEIVTYFSPLADYLQQQLGREVELRSAPDFNAFIDRTRGGDYDLIFTAPHLGRLAQKQSAFQPLAQSGWRIEVLVVTRKEGALQQLDDLKHHSLAIGAKLSMTYQLVNHALALRGLQLEREVEFIQTASFSNVIEAVVRGEADAGATGTILWQRAPEAQRAALKEIYRSESVPGFLLLSHPRLGEARYRQLRQALLSFATSAAGQRYFSTTGQIDFRPLDEETMRSLDPFTGVLRLFKALPH